MKFPTTYLQVCCLCGEAFRRFVLLALLGVLASTSAEAQVPAAAPAGLAIIITIEGRVEVLRGGAGAWVAAEPNQRLGIGDKLRTGENSRATIQLANSSVERLRSLTVITIEAPRKAEGLLSLLLERGALFFKSWAKPETQEFRTPTVAGAIRGTEFYLTVADDGSTVVSLIDGEVNLTSPDGSLPLKSGEQATIERGRAPAKTAVLETTRLVQWYLYYPGVLDIGELGLSELQQRELFASWSAYAAGDLPGALRLYPAGRAPGNPSEAVYRAGLLLSVGDVAQAEAQLAKAEAAAAANSRPARLAAALREVMAAVQFQAVATNTPPELASEWVARSYLLQSRFDLAGALHAAQQAARISPNFGFAHARVAELEFSHGRTRETAAALTKALEFSPVNAQAIALEGFVRAAQNRHREAQESFERAIEADPALGNGWLGRGLIKIRRGQTQQGLADLQVAAALEPNRALLRSYLGKTYAISGDQKHAVRELSLAKNLDPSDPTSWLYSALVDQQQNRINDAVRGMERSRELNDNRSVFRSRLLLDQDKAMRGANLATIFGDARMPEQGVREAAKAVASDYGNHSAHLFLANTYEQLRDPNQNNLRYDTPAFSEYLVGVLLAPVGGGILSPSVTQNEYSRLLEKDGLGFSSSTEYSGRGDIFENAVQHGTIGDTAYAIEGRYRHSNGWRPNNDFEARQLSLELAHQLTPNDSLYAWVFGYSSRGGDVTRLADPTKADLTLRTQEHKDPNLLVGHHHQWSPESHTLMLFGRLTDVNEVSSDVQRPLILVRSGGISYSLGVSDPPGRLTYRGSQEVYLGEIQHFTRFGRHTVVAGLRAQAGEFRTQARLKVNDPTLGGFVPTQEFTSPIERLAGYLYDFHKPMEKLTLITGFTVDHLRFPGNFRYAPLSSEVSSRSGFGPKAGLIIEPWTNAALRFSYGRSLSGADIDTAFSMEPSQLAGVVQNYRSIIPDGVTGGNSGTWNDVIGVEAEQRLPGDVYLRLGGRILYSEANRLRGALEVDPINGVPPVLYSQLNERIQYRERSLELSANKLLGRYATIGGTYAVTESCLSGRFTDFADDSIFSPPLLRESQQTALLHHSSLRLSSAYPVGFFSDLELNWLRQEIRDLIATESIQMNAFVGMRLLRRRAEIRIGILNVADRRVDFSGINPVPEFPQRRTFTARLRIAF